MTDEVPLTASGPPPEEAALIQEATALHQAGELEQAEQLYRAILRADPDQVSSLQLLGVLHNQRGEYVAGARCFQEAMRLRPRSAMACLNLGVALWNLRRLDEAQAILQRALILSPDNPEALLNSGLVLQELGRHEEVLEQLDRLLSLEPKHPEAHLHRGDSLLELHRPAEALASFEAALRIRQDSSARRGRCRALMALKRPEEALASLDASACAPKDLDALLERGLALLELRRAEMALTDFDQVLSVRPDSLEALANRCLTLRELHRAAEAEQALDEALAVYGKATEATNPKVVLLLVSMLMDLGRYEDALGLLGVPFDVPDLSLSIAGERARGWHLALLHWLTAFLKAPVKGLSGFREGASRFVLPMVVWGDDYLDTLEQFTLPSLMAEANLPYLSTIGDAHLLFFTTEAGAARLQRMPIVAELRHLLCIEVITFPEELTRNGDNYRLMSTMHLASMEVAKASESHFLFLAPDLVFAENFLRTLDQRMHEGFDVVFAPGLILHLEDFAAEQARVAPTVDGRLSLAPHDLLSLGMRHVHPFVKQDYVYTSNARRSTVAVFLWPLEGGGFVMHGYHHTPFLISAEAMSRFDGSMFNNLDGNFLPKIIRTQEELDRCSMLNEPSVTNYFELSRANRFVSGSDDEFQYDMGAFSLERLSRFGLHLGGVATWLLPQQVCFDPTGRGGDPVVNRESQEVVDQILEGIRLIQATIGRPSTMSRLESPQAGTPKRDAS